MPRSYGTTNAAPYATAPAVGAAGDTYYNTATKTLYLSDGTAWNAISAGAGADEVFIGPSDPGVGGSYELWYDSDAPSYAVPSVTPASYWFSRLNGLAIGTTATNITLSASILASGFSITAAGALCNVAGKYGVTLVLTHTGTVTANGWIQPSIRQVRSGATVVEYFTVGDIGQTWTQADVTCELDLLAGDEVQVFAYTSAAGRTADTRSQLAIVPMGGPKGDTGATGPQGPIGNTGPVGAAYPSAANRAALPVASASAGLGYYLNDEKVAVVSDGVTWRTIVDDRNLTALRFTPAGPASMTDYAIAPHQAGMTVTGDLCIVAKISPDLWNPGTGQSQRIASRWAGNKHGYIFTLQANGALQFFWSPDGSATTLNAAATVFVPNTVDGGWKWVAVTLDVDNGAAGRDVRFWSSDDGATWTQVGATVTTAGVTSLFATTSELLIGVQEPGAVFSFKGRIAVVSIRNGIGAAGAVGGTEVARFDSTTPWYGNNYVDPEGNVWTWSKSGPTPATTLSALPLPASAPGQAWYVADTQTIVLSDGTRWRTIYGDTGWRQLAAGDAYDPVNWSMANARIRRLGHTVYMDGYANCLTAGQSTASVVAIYVPPVGFRTVGGLFDIPASFLVGGSFWPSSLRNLGGTTGIQTAATAGLTGRPAAYAIGDRVNLALSWTTTEAWPVTLPGTATGVIP
jgi:hypothetical protein